MVDIKIGNDFAELGTSFQMEGVILNPMFSESGFSEGYSYQFRLQDTVKNRTLIANTYNKCSILIGGLEIFAGYFYFKEKVDNLLSILFINTELKTVNTLNSKKIAEYTWPTIAVAHPGDDDATRLTKWANKWTEVMATESPKEGIFKMPMIATNGYIPADGNDPSNRPYNYNNIWLEHDNMVNAYSVDLGGLVKNWAAPTTNGTINWANTVAPCPRVEYILQTILYQLGFSITKNELESIDEFMQMWTFNNYVLDKEVSSNISFVNSWQDAIYLEKHMPDCNAIEVFILLKEFFDAFFVIENQTISIHLTKTVLDTPIVNYSKYLADEKSNESEELVNYKLKYSYTEEDKLRYWTTTNNLPSTTIVKEYNMLDRLVDNNQETTVEINLNHVPLGTDYTPFPNFVQSYIKYLDWLANSWDVENWLDAWILKPRCIFLSQVKSDAYPDANVKIADKFQVGCFRGYFSTPRYNEFTDTYIGTIDYPFSYNLKTTKYSSNMYPFTHPVVGNNALYQTDDDNLFDTYKAKRFEKKTIPDLKERTYILPVHIFKEIIQFKNPRHIIQQLDESFVGIVREVKFAIDSTGLVETKIVYQQ